MSTDDRAGVRFRGGWPLVPALLLVAAGAGGFRGWGLSAFGALLVARRRRRRRPS